MKGVVVLLALVGCYRPGSETPCTITCTALGDCPDGLVCNTANNRCGLTVMGCMPGDAPDGDAALDGRPNIADAPSDGTVTVDGPIAALCVPGSAFGTIPLTQGTWFTPDLDGNPQLAVKYDEANIKVVENTANTNNGALYTSMFPPMIETQFDAPRLAPTLQQAFFLRRVSGVASLQRATRQGPGSWSTMTVLLKDETGQMTMPITGIEEIGAPTTTTPRYMLIKSDTSVIEYAEFSATEWRRVMTHTPAFTGIAFLGRATLNEDGRRMVFRGQTAAANVAGFYADRAGPRQPFTTVATRIPSLTSDSVDTPYLSEDCHDYYYTFTLSNQIQHVTYQ